MPCPDSSWNLIVAPWCSMATLHLADMQLRERFTGASILGYQNRLTYSCTCSRAIQAARQVTYSLKAAGERRRPALLAPGVPPTLVEWHLDILEAIAECLRQAGLSRSWQPLCQTIVYVLQLTACSGHCLFKGPRSCILASDGGSCSSYGTIISMHTLTICVQKVAGSTTRWRQPHPMLPG